MFYLKIIFSIVAIFLMSLIGLISFSPVNDFYGTITIEVVDEYGEIVISQEVDFENRDTLFHLMDSSFELTYRKYSVGIAIYSINNVHTDFQTSYFAIYVNEEYSRKGVELIALIDGNVYSFRKEVL